MNNSRAIDEGLPEGLIREEGERLVFDGADLKELANEYGTPLFVYSEKRLRKNLKSFQTTFTEYYPKAEISFALKSAPLLALARIVKDEGGLAEVISPGELYLANRAGFTGEEIIYNGNNKSRESVRSGVDSRVLINVDSRHELKIVAEEAKRLEVPARVGIRVNPVVSAKTVEEWETAVEDSKFGIPIKGGKAFAAYEEAEGNEWLEVTGIHSHIGSQIESLSPYRKATDRLLRFYQAVHERLGTTLERIDLGGGFPIRFSRKGDGIPSLDEYAEATVGQVGETLTAASIPLPDVFLEPGGSLVGTTGLLVLSVGTIKKNAGKIIVAVDGGANVNLRATQGWYRYDFAALSKPGGGGSDEGYRVVGPLCYNGDVLSERARLPKLEEGDLVACLEAGAYTVSTMNRYNSYPLPPVVLISGESTSLIQAGEALEDLAKDQRVPDHLRG